MNKKSLLIVESPAKANTIKKCLGKDFDVMASMGHVCDLPKYKLGVDISKDFEASYSILKDKSKIVKSLKKKIDKFSKVLLATDPDREGEAIAWHLARILKLDFNEKNRITFNEITKSGIKSGIDNPRKIDFSLVNSQQARRILDRLVGYKISPFLCKKIQKGTSAGRVQSVALKLLVDREKEIEKFVPQEYWTITATLETKEGNSEKQFKSSFWGTIKEQIKLSCKDDAQKILDNLKNAKYSVYEVKKGKRHKKPPAPFITSTLQQEASKKLGFSSKQTMCIAQELYEGLKIDGFGSIGLITYMRTDSTRISSEARTKSEEFILQTWGQKYLPSKPRIFKMKKNAQDAHEAIRPTIPDITPEKVKKSLNSNQFKLYKLIWSRFISSQMSDCIQNTIQVKILANDYIFKSSGTSIEFDGFTILYPESKKDDEEILPFLDVGMICDLKKLTPEQHFTEPPPRFNEASLIKNLEENGVGRPSTYSSIISTLINREYARKENRSFVITELGQEVDKLMKKYFSNIANVRFTAKMEENLDKIEKNEVDWKSILREFYSKLESYLKTAKEDSEGLKVEIKENKTDIICELCGKPMVIKKSRFGKFIGCSGFPDCKNIKKIVQNIGIKCHKCGGDIVQKKSKKNRTFYGCSNYPKCDFVSWYKPTGNFCPKCKGPLFLRRNEVFCERCNKIKEKKITNE